MFFRSPPSEPIVTPGPRRSTRHASPESDDDTRELWGVMLDLQQRYHCYNSTRMQIAADSDAAGEMMRKSLHVLFLFPAARLLISFLFCQHPAHASTS